MKKASNLIPVFITAGTIIHGRGIGKLIGMPTANLKIADKKGLPPEGVYIATATLENETY